MKRFILALLFWLCLAGPSWGAPTFDAQSQETMFDATSFSWTHTIGGACTNNIVVVAVAHYDANATTLMGVTVNGAAAAQIATIAPGGGSERLTTFEKEGASSGTVEVIFSGSNGFGIGTARSYCGVDQTTPLGTAVTNSSEDSTTVTVNVSSAASEMVIDAALVIGLPVTATVGAGQTQRSNLTDLNGDFFRLVESDEAGAASVTMSWGLDAGHGWLTIGVPLKEASAGAGTVLRRRPIILH
jgi:hypothetical protein